MPDFEVKSHGKRYYSPKCPECGSKKAAFPQQAFIPQRIGAPKPLFQRNDSGADFVCLKCHCVWLQMATRVFTGTEEK